MDILLERLTTRLDLLRTTPHPILAALRHLGIKALLLLVGGRRRGRASGARGSRLRRRGRIFGRIGCCSSRRPSCTSRRCNEAHKVFGIVGDVVCEPDTDFLGVGEVAVQLVRESVVEAIACIVRPILQDKLCKQKKPGRGGEELYHHPP